jgi:hypothetical protein
VELILNDEYSVKLALIEEYKKVLKYKKIYEDLVESFQYMIADLFQYADKQKIDLPNRDRIYRNMERARDLIQYRINNMESDGDLTEPKMVYHNRFIIFCRILISSTNPIITPDKQEQEKRLSQYTDMID